MKAKSWISKPPNLLDIKYHWYTRKPIPERMVKKKIMYQVWYICMTGKKLKKKLQNVKLFVLIVIGKELGSDNKDL